MQILVIGRCVRNDRFEDWKVEKIQRKWVDLEGVAVFEMIDPLPLLVSEEAVQELKWWPQDEKGNLLRIRLKGGRSEARVGEVSLLRLKGDAGRPHVWGRMVWAEEVIE